MSAKPPALWLRVVSPTVARAGKFAAPTTEQSTRRRIGLIWGLLFFNVLGVISGPSLIPIGSSVARVLTQGSLGVAFVLALSMNRRIILRLNLFLTLFTVLCVTTMMASATRYFGVGSILLAARFIVFVAVLWLITPWWGQSDLMLCRIHWRAMLVVLSSVIVGLVLAPGRSFVLETGGRLGGVLWPIRPTQVAHYAAVFTGLTVVLWLSKARTSRWTPLFVAVGLTILILTRTRTALLGMLLGILVAGLSLFVTRKRVRRAFAVILVVAAIGAFSFAPFISRWFIRGENSTDFSNFTGRSLVWSQLLAAPRTEVHVLFGYGMSNDQFYGRAPNGSITELAIDSSWLSTYDDQGLVGDVIIGSAVLLLLIKGLISPRGPARAIALFLVVYCLVASITETGLGDPSSYLLDLSMATSVLMAPMGRRTRAGTPSEDALTVT